VRISVTCGKGTYIRALARDIGAALGCGAHVEELRRLSIGPFRDVDACSAEKLDALVLDPIGAGHIRPLREIGASFHRVILTEEAERRLSSGLCVPAAEAGRYLPGTVELRNGLCVEGKKMIGFADIVESDAAGDGMSLKPRANIADALDVNAVDANQGGAR
jgi:tRNA U55 pseudouridine synthase TruB